MTIATSVVRGGERDGVENEGQFRNREGVIDDSYRIRFISEHLWHTLRAREAGANCGAICCGRLPTTYRR